MASITNPDLEADALALIASRFKALSEPVRLRMLNLLATSGEMCVCDFEAPLDISQPTVSHHLRVLARAGLVRREKRGKWAYYTVEFGAMDELARVLDPPEA